jgi:hypothetical protein
MASELRVNTLKDAAGANSVAMEYVAGGSAKAWVNFDGTGTIAARDSLNLSSLSDDGTGLYTVTVLSAFSNDDFSTAGAGGENSGGGNRMLGLRTTTTTTKGLRGFSVASSTVDLAEVCVQITGDLA